MYILLLVVVFLTGVCLFFLRRLKNLKSLLLSIVQQNGAVVFRPMFIHRIGHLAGEVDLLLKERILTGLSSNPFALIVCENSAANPHLVTYLREKFQLLISPSDWARLNKIFPCAKKILAERPDYYIAINKTARCYSIYTEWGDRKPLFQLRSDDSSFLRKQLKQWGLSEDSWFVCLHNRERGYSPVDDDLHDYRNATIDSYLPAIQEITRRGGWVIRMGHPTMTRLPPLPHVIDYAHSELRCPQLDICLCASARFFLGTSSGLFIVGTIFGVPAALVNLAPFSAEAFTPADVKISKLVATKEGGVLSFPEVMNSAISNYRFSEEYQKAGVKLLCNSPDEILDLTTEMLGLIEGGYEYSEEDKELQKCYRSMIQPNHYGFGSSARIGRDFLRKHKTLLTNNCQNLCSGDKYACL